MELIFGEGCDGDAQAMILAPLVGWNVTIARWEHSAAMYCRVEEVSGRDGGTLTVRSLGPDAGLVDEYWEAARAIEVLVDDIQRMEIH